MPVFVVAPREHPAVDQQRVRVRAPTRGDRDRRRGQVHGDRCEALLGGSIAQLAGEIGAPCEHGSLVGQRQRKQATRSDRNDGLRHRNRNRHRARRRGSVAELSQVVCTPRPDGPIATQRKRMARSGRDARDLSERTDRHRRRAIRHRAVAELAERVVAPGTHRAIGEHGEREGAHAFLACSDRARRAEAGYGLRRRTIDRRAVAELAVAIAAPAPDLAVGPDRQRVAEADRQRGYIGQSDHVDRIAANVERAVAELAVAVAAPGAQRTVGAQADRIRTATAHPRQCHARIRANRKQRPGRRHRTGRVEHAHAEHAAVVGKRDIGDRERRARRACDRREIHAVGAALPLVGQGTAVCENGEGCARARRRGHCLRLLRDHRLHRQRNHGQERCAAARRAGGVGRAHPEARAVVHGLRNEGNRGRCFAGDVGEVASAAGALPLQGLYDRRGRCGAEHHALVLDRLDVDRLVHDPRRGRLHQQPCGAAVLEDAAEARHARCVERVVVRERDMRDQDLRVRLAGQYEPVAQPLVSDLRIVRCKAERLDTEERETAFERGLVVRLVDDVHRVVAARDADPREGGRRCPYRVAVVFGDELLPAVTACVGLDQEGTLSGWELCRVERHRQRDRHAERSAVRRQ